MSKQMSKQMSKVMSKISPLDQTLPAQIAELLDPRTVRKNSRLVYEHVKAGNGHFNIHENKLEECARTVIRTINENYPDANIPIHGRWNHFKIQKFDYLKPIEEKLAKLPPADRACALWDLCLVSVLLDAGAGEHWKFQEPQTSLVIGRSEGLALASLAMFQKGLFSSDPARPLQVDSRGLQNLTLLDLQTGFQVTATNPMVGLEGRLLLLKTLGKTIEQSDFFNDRPSDLFLTLAEKKQLKARDLLLAILLGLGPIWPARLSKEGFALGDVWQYQSLPGLLVPFHKLSQWLTYSMMAPFEILGVQIQDVQELTGLPEYRNGGLFIDTDVLQLKDPQDAQKAHLPSSDLIIEWRALTVVLLDKVATIIRNRLGKTENEWPLGKILEGGTWSAGRKVAAQKRGPLAPAPLNIQSDGTVF